MRIKDKVVVITGAGSGVGLAITKRFLAEGARIIAVDLDARALADTVEPLGGAVVAITGNVAEEAVCVAMIDRAISEFGRIDVLVNNAGVMDRFASVADMDNATWRRCMAVNVDGAMFAMRKAVPLMLAQGSGSIINTASTAGVGGASAGAAYTAAKHALIGLTRSTAYQYARQGLRCNALALGGVETNIMAEASKNFDQRAMERLGAYHLSSPGAMQPDDIASVALFLASDDSIKVNGAILPVDMGWRAA